MLGDWRPVRGRDWAQGPGRRVPAGTGLPQSPLQVGLLQKQEQSAARFFTPPFRVETPGMEGGLYPQSASMATVGQGMALDGLGALGAIGCRDVEPLLEELKHIIDNAGSKLSSASRISAQVVYDDIASYALYVPFLGTDCGKHVTELKATIAALRAELGSAAPAPLRPHATIVTGAAPDAASDMPFWQKAAIIGGIGVAGLVAVAVITGQVAPLLRTVKKVTG